MLVENRKKAHFRKNSHTERKCKTIIEKAEKTLPESSSYI